MRGGKPLRRVTESQMERRFSALRPKAPPPATALDSLGMAVESSVVCDEWVVFGEQMKIRSVLLSTTYGLWLPRYPPPRIVCMNGKRVPVSRRFVSDVPSAQ